MVEYINLLNSTIFAHLKQKFQTALQQQEMQEQQQAALTAQAGQIASSPMMDPSKNPAMGRTLNDGYDQLNGNEQTIPPPEGEDEEALPAEGFDA